MTNTCFICGETKPNSIERHHIVPRRYGGSDRDENLVALCASCHAAVEKLYDEGFYRRLGVEKTNPDDIQYDSLDDVEEIEDGGTYYLSFENQFFVADGAGGGFLHLDPVPGREGRRRYAEYIDRNGLGPTLSDLVEMRSKRYAIFEEDYVFAVEITGDRLTVMEEEMKRREPQEIEVPQSYYE